MTEFNQKDKQQYMCIDHNHITNKVRGIVCNICNSGLGYFDADSGTEVLESALKWMKEVSDGS